MKNFVGFTLPFLICNIVSAQSFQWAYSTGSINSDVGQSITVDNNGNVYTASRYNYDLSIHKNDSNGNLVWIKIITGHIDASGRSPAIISDEFGNIYITGVFANTVDFDPGAGNYNLTGSNKAYILKLDTFGNFIWAKMLDGASGISHGTTITMSETGFLYIGGYYNGNIDFNPGIPVHIISNYGSPSDAYILKLDTAGNFVWASAIVGKSINYAWGVAIDAAENVILTGHFRDTADFDPGPGVYNLVAGNSHDMFIMKLNSSGNFMWARNMGGAFDVISYTVDTDPAGNIYASGSFIDTCDFDPGPGINYGISNGGSDIFVVKLDYNGDFLWVRTAGGLYTDASESLAFSNQGAIIITGYYLLTVDFDPGQGVFSLSALSREAFLWSLDINGEFISAKSVDGPGLNGANAMTVDSINNIYLTGYLVDTVDFNPPFLYNLYSMGGSDIFTAKYGPVSVAIAESGSASVFNLYPNPGSENFIIEMNKTNSGEYFIHNLLGELIKSGRFENTNSFRFEIFDCPGVYFITLFTDQGIVRLKAIKSH